MTNDFFVTGLILVTLIIGAALLPISTLLDPHRREQVGIGLIGGLCALLVAMLHVQASADGISFVYPGILASVSFLFGPLAGGVATLCSLVSLMLDTHHAWWIGLGLAISMWGIGSVTWLVQKRTQLSFWLLFSVLMVLVPMCIAPWATLGDPTTRRGWYTLDIIPWRYMVGVILLCGGVGLIMSRARTQRMLQLSKNDLVQALRASGGGRWEWHARKQLFSYHGSLFRDFGLDDSPDDDEIAPLRQLMDDAHFAELRSRIDRDDFAMMAPSLLRVIEGQSPHFHGEFRIRDNHGRLRKLIARGAAVEFDKSGYPLRLSGMLLDVTEQHEMANALRLSEIKYTTFYKTLPDPAGIVRMSDGRFIDANPAMERMCQLSLPEIIGKTADEFGLSISQHDRIQLTTLIDDDSEFNGMNLKIRLRGASITGVFSARSALIEGERCLIFVFHDMTHTHVIEENLRVSSHSLNQASWLARLGVWEGIPGRGVTYWSDVCCEIHGVPAGTPPPADYVDRYVAPEWREQVRQISRHERNAHMIWETEFEIIRADRQRAWVRVRSETVMTDGKLLKIRGVLQDVDNLRRTSERMLASEARFAHIFQALPISLAFVRRDDGRVVDVNPAWERSSGYTREMSLGHTLVDLGIYTAQTRENMLREARKTGELIGYENELRSFDGKTHTVLQSMSSIDVGGQACWLISLINITERKQQELRVREREELLSLTLAAASLGTWDFDLLTGNVRGDARWYELHGEDAAFEHNSEPTPWDIGIGNEQIALIESALQRHQMNPSTPFDATWRIAPPQAPTRWLRNVGKVVEYDKDGAAQRMVGVTMDVTLQHEQQELLHHLAHYDSQTGLPNRVLLGQRLRDAVELSNKKGHQLAITYIDLDALKAINDRLGHDVGDRLLVLVAGRVQRALRPADCVARLGGDEFVVLLSDLSDREAAEKRLRALMDAVAAPYDVEGEPIHITASVGYTLFPEDSADTDTLLRHADQAMYLAKQAGGNRLRAFDSVQEMARLSLVEHRARVDQAMNNGELSLYLQPKVDMRTGAVIGAEALVRWVHPELGVILPGSFLHVIDGTELEAKFSEWAMDSVLTHISQLKSQGLEMQISVNIDAERLRHRDFANWVLGHLERHPDVQPRQLDLEITENAALYDINHVARELAQLRAIGISVSLDDFGTGYSSLAYLRRLPIDQLKLDQSYVRGMMQDPADQAIVQGVIGLARSFGYRIVAEGVESVEQGILLVRMGCLIAQGHIISRPMPAEHFADWAKHWHAPRSWLESARTIAEPLPLV
ncbi:EAL domain-containing protein [Diaphorobacter sp. HDW4A]|uniref:EAL domain-containing protein n=1 Tax=Diaphorobacter sp. HDW4A TaxID=2714924 RepID=UPI00140882A0|nr:EAL domain-containing protein [Diaphorobacter sp. HDW4A]QIL80249.1 EAL domain-containing protein [Diaphorobacter sp. HDW4A]